MDLTPTRDTCDGHTSRLQLEARTERKPEMQQSKNEGAGPPMIDDYAKPLACPSAGSKSSTISTSTSNQKQVTGEDDSKHSAKAKPLAAVCAANFKKNSSLKSSFSDNESIWFQHFVKGGKNDGKPYFHQPNTGAVKWDRPEADVKLVEGKRGSKPEPPKELLRATCKKSKKHAVPSSQFPQMNIPSALNTSDLITECATTWSIIGFIITSVYTGIHGIFAKDGDETITKFYAWVIKPFCYTTMAISLLLKPRRNNFAYKAFLYSQYVLFTIGSELLTIAGHKWKQDGIIIGALWAIFWLCLLLFAMRVRARVARLSDQALSKFLSKSLVRGGLIVGLGQLAFLALSSLQCYSEAR